MLNQSQVNDLIEELSDRKYWDIKYQDGKMGKIGNVQTRMEYDKETCEKIIELILRAFSMNLRDDNTHD